MEEEIEVVPAKEERTIFCRLQSKNSSGRYPVDKKARNGRQKTQGGEATVHAKRSWSQWNLK